MRFYSYKLLVNEYFHAASSEGGTSCHQMVIDFNTEAEADFAYTSISKAEGPKNSATRVIKLYEPIY